MNQHTGHAPSRTVELDVHGMTCASCASRIEKVLRKQPGVTDAAVNLAVERARIELGDEACSVEDLVRAVERAGYGAQPRDEGHGAHGEDHTDHLLHDRSPGYYLRRALVAAVFTVPAVVISMSDLAHSDWAMVAAGILVTPVQWFSGWPFLRSAARQARHLSANMDTLVALGTLAAYLYSVWSTAVGRHDHYFEVAGVVITLLLVGKYLEGLSKGRASDAIRRLLELGAKDARVIRDGEQILVPVEELRRGDVFVVGPGEKIATDGVVRTGSSAIDESMVTGESVPREKAPGDEVLGGTINAHGSLTVEAMRVGSDTALARIVRLVEEAQAAKAPIQRMADRVSAVFVPAIIGIATLTLLGWLAAGRATGEALIPAVAVLIIACPCAMGLATPVAILVGTGRGAQLGVLVRGGEVLERSRDVDVVVFDKTGTLTEGEMTVTDVLADPWNDGSVSADDVLSAAASVEAHSEHPIARAVVTAARERNVEVPVSDGFAAVGGLGARSTVNGRIVTVGRPALLADDGLMSCAELDERRAALEQEGKTVFAVGWDRRVRGLIAVADRVKPTARAAVEALRDMGVEAVMVTGDNEATARAVARSVGIENVIAGVLPEQKVDQVRTFQRAGRRVAMVGDGINDAPALAAADLGIAIGSGTDVAIEAADITLVRSDVLGVPTAVRLARRTMRTIVQNLFWAFGYNVVLVPLAIAGRISPMLAGFAMALSSVSVVLNALRLRRVAAVNG